MNLIRKSTLIALALCTPFAVMAASAQQDADGTGFGTGDKEVRHNGLQLNALTLNGLQANVLSFNGLQVNALGLNASAASGAAREAVARDGRLWVD